MKATLPVLFLCITVTVLFGNGSLLIFAIESRPNVVLIITDDQGYGDIAAHGNKIIQTPKMDKLRDESIRFT
ncbi:MAG: sulfatase-like hydrolase/transferase, partial [Planctomycetaceae bacterium]|nr:sulfatase-like hydrolase/transferase [Planctomycetaceae bacterium]